MLFKREIIIGRRESMKYEIDELDRAMIKLLSGDGRMSFTELSSRLSVTEKTVRSRYKNLIENDILSVVGVVNPIALGLKAEAIIQMVLREPSGMKAATGENPKNVHGGKGKMPTTRMGVAARLREKFIEAEHYQKQYENGQVARNLGLENLCKVLNKEIPLRVHANRADDIATVLRLKRELDIEITIEHCTEGHLIADFIAEHDVRVSVGPTMSSKSKVELAGKTWNTLIALTNAGVPVSITTDHPVVGIEHLMTSAIMAVKNGLSETDALKAITINAAKHLGVEERVGSIEIGKDADFVVWNGDPFDLRSSVLETYIQGECVSTKGS